MSNDYFFNLTLTTDTDCEVYLEGVKQLQLLKGIAQVLSLSPGKYMLKFVSIENPNNTQNVEFEMPEKDSMCAVRFDTRFNEKSRKNPIKIEPLNIAGVAALLALAVMSIILIAQHSNKANEENLQTNLLPVDSALTFTVKGVPFTMKPVKGGSFVMGESGYDKGPAHTVQLSGFWMGETEVTQLLWEVVMRTSIIEQLNKEGRSNYYGQGADYPMYCVSYWEAEDFCEKLNDLLLDQLPSGYHFTLPTEAQWEFAAKGGNHHDNYYYSGSNYRYDVMCVSCSGSCKVKQRQPNTLGIYDMTGNVWEWCSDLYGNYSLTEQIDPKGPSSGLARVRRGGSNDYDLPVYHRNDQPGFRLENTGFRLVLTTCDNSNGEKQ